MTSSVMTKGQLERELSQRIQALYRDELEHRPSKVTCQILDREVAVIIEDAITQAEQLLAREGREKLAEEVRSDLGEVIRPKITEIIQEVLQVEVVDFLSDATLDTGRSGFIAVLSDKPQFRESKSSKR
ncbi:MAG: DUF2294 domain-containing protein [Elainellaceae cyanobacterium]